MTRASKRRNERANNSSVPPIPSSSPMRPQKKVDEKKTPEKFKGKKDCSFPPGDMRAHVNKVTPKLDTKKNNGVNDDQKDKYQNSDESSILSSDTEGKDDKGLSLIHI